MVVVQYVVVQMNPVESTWSTCPVPSCASKSLPHFSHPVLALFWARDTHSPQAPPPGVRCKLQCMSGHCTSIQWSSGMFFRAPRAKEGISPAWHSNEFGPKVCLEDAFPAFGAQVWACKHVISIQSTYTDFGFLQTNLNLTEWTRFLNLNFRRPEKQNAKTPECWTRGNPRQSPAFTPTPLGIPSVQSTKIV